MIVKDFVKKWYNTSKNVDKEKFKVDQFVMTWKG
jgi:hypothetical protein